MTELIKCTSCRSQKMTSLFAIKPNTGVRNKCCIACLQKEKCPQCDFQASKSNMFQHINIVHNGKTIQCPKCEHRCSRSSDLKKHIKSVHENLQDQQCPHCEFKCSRACSLKLHIKGVHNQIKDFVCDRCDYKTSYKGHLNEHILSVHEQVREQQCPHCEHKSFSQVNLKTHIESVHEKIKNHACALCDYKCYGRDSLKSHVKAVHERIRDNACPRCNYKTAEAGNLRKHMLVCTGDEKMSSGEFAIKGVLESMQIAFEREMAFVDCRGDSHTLRFDFYLPHHIAAIEFDGKQHFEPVAHWGGQESLERTQRHDAIKNAYCESNNIRLLRIKYTDFERIPELVEAFIIGPVDT